MSGFNIHRLGFRSMAGALALVGSVGLLGAAPALAWDWGFGPRVVGSGQVTKTQRQVPAFKSLAMEVPANVEIVQGGGEGVVIETDDNIAPLIETVVERDELKVRLFKRSTSLKPTILKITVNARNMEKVSMSGYGKLNIEKLQTPSLEMHVSGSGDVRIAALATDSLAISIAGSGDFSASGRADAVRASIAGSGDLKLAKLAAKTVKISIAGSGSAKVWSSQSLDVSVAGSGDVAYYGDAAVTQSVAGSGSVKRLGAVPSQ